MSGNKKTDPFFLVWYSIADEIYGLMILQSATKRTAESGFRNIAEAHVAQHPHCLMKLEKMVLMESPEQVQKEKDELKAKHPRQLFADEYCPENPNAFLFRPLSGSNQEIQDGRAEEEIIRQMCDGFLI